MKPTVTGWALAVLMLTCVVLGTGMFLLTISMVLQLVTTNQLIYLLGVPVCGALGVLYIRILIKLMD